MGSLLTETSQHAHEAAGGRLWANQRERIQHHLERLGITENEWCKQELGRDIATMRRRVQLAKGWDEYERNRRSQGDNGQYGLFYGLSLTHIESGRAMNAGRSGTHSAPEEPKLDITKCQFITGEALSEIRRLKSRVGTGHLGRYLSKGDLTARKQADHTLAHGWPSGGRRSIGSEAGQFLKFVSNLMQPRADCRIGNRGGNPVRFLGEFEEALIEIVCGLYGTLPRVGVQ
jgi:hypothetical protein